MLWSRQQKFWISSFGGRFLHVFFSGNLHAIWIQDDGVPLGNLDLKLGPVWTDFRFHLIQRPLCFEVDLQTWISFIWI